MLIYITGVKVTGSHSLELTFNDGSVKRVNLLQELWGEVFEPLRDPEYFAQVQLNEWTIYWLNGADFTPQYLYEMAPESQALMERR